jgi:hypothetical protein
MMLQNLLNFGQWWLGVLSPAGGLFRRGLASVIWGKIRKITNSDFSAYFVQFLQSFQFDVMGHIWCLFYQCACKLMDMFSSGTYHHYSYESIYGWRLRAVTRSVLADVGAALKFFWLYQGALYYHLIRGIGGMRWVLQYLILSKSLF